MIGQELKFVGEGVQVFLDLIEFVIDFAMFISQAGTAGLLMRMYLANSLNLVKDE